MESYQRTEEAIKSGVFSQEIVGVDNGMEVVREDEEVGRYDPNTFRTSRTLWGETIGWGSCSKVTSVSSLSDSKFNIKISSWLTGR